MIYGVCLDRHYVLRVSDDYFLPTVHEIIRTTVAQFFLMYINFPDFQNIFIFRFTYDYFRFSVFIRDWMTLK
jgi:hypothetical protein